MRVKVATDLGLVVELDNVGSIVIGRVLPVDGSFGGGSQIGRPRGLSLDPW
jgi:hypothetical protein